MKIVMVLLFALWNSGAHAGNRCVLGGDVPSEVQIPGVAVIIFREPQCFAVYEGGRLSQRHAGRQLYGYASTGMPGHDTPLSDTYEGPKRIYLSSEYHYSSKYSVRIQGKDVPAYMPWALFFDGDNALHAGFDLSPFASHGCVRLPRRAAKALFYGFNHDNIQVIVTENRDTLAGDWEDGYFTRSNN